MNNPTRFWSRLSPEFLSVEGNGPIAERCFVSCVQYYWVGRNAWRGSRSNLYPDDSAFSTKFRPLVEDIERSRRQGSQFFIRELPALVLQGAGESVVLLELNGAAPFLASRTPDIQLSGIFALAHWLIGYRVDSIGWKVQRPPKPAVEPFRLFRSMTHGPDFPLDWVEVDKPLNTAPIYELAGQLSRGIRRRGKPTGASI
jgi:hypothetical protein